MGAGGKWSTEEVNRLIKEFNKIGKMPRNNPFYMGDVNKRDANINYFYTVEESKELAKINRDILYFGETYARVMTDEGVRVVKLREYQKKNLLQLKKFRYNVWLASRQIGKCVTFDTHVFIYDKKLDKNIEIPMYKLHYGYKSNLRFLDKVEYFFFGILYRLKKKMRKLKPEKI